MNLKSPLFLRLSDRLDVYIRLMRADKPIGTLLLLWPTYWALWLASDGIPDWTVLAAFTIGTFLMRSAGCVINDFADRDFDGAVERTKNRPFAQGRVGKKEALLLTAFLCLLAALCLIPLNHLTWLMSLPALFLALTYPFTKRFFSDSPILSRTCLFLRYPDGVCCRCRKRAASSVDTLCRQCVMDSGV